MIASRREYFSREKPERPVERKVRVLSGTKGGIGRVNGVFGRAVRIVLLLVEFSTVELEAADLTGTVRSPDEKTSGGVFESDSVDDTAGTERGVEWRTDAKMKMVIMHRQCDDCPCRAIIERV